jgi:hypothetical protein
MHHTRSHPAPAKKEPIDIRGGVKLGLGFAVGYSILAGVALTMGVANHGTGADGGAAQAFHDWQLAVGFYVVAGILGGAMYGLLKPIQHRFLGRCLTAYILLVLVYGGGTAAFLPIFAREDGPTDLPAWFFVLIWAVICIVLAPIYALKFGKRRDT